MEELVATRGNYNREKWGVRVAGFAVHSTHKQQADFGFFIFKEASRGRNYMANRQTENQKQPVLGGMAYEAHSQSDHGSGGTDSIIFDTGPEGPELLLDWILQRKFTELRIWYHFFAQCHVRTYRYQQGAKE